MSPYASQILLNLTSEAFLAPQSFADFFFLFKTTLNGACGFVGLCAVVAFVSAVMRKCVCFDFEEDEKKPRAVKVQEEADAAQWGTKSTLQILIGLAVFGFSVAAVCLPVVMFPDGYNFYYLGRCHGDVCQKWNWRYWKPCDSYGYSYGTPPASFCYAALLSAGSGGAAYVLILLLELSRRCCPDSCLGYDPDGRFGNPSKGYCIRWILLLLRMSTFSIHICALTFTLFFILIPGSVCVNGSFVWENMLQAGGSLSHSFYALCIALGFVFIDIWVDGVLGEVGNLTILQAKDEIALHDLVPPPKSIISSPTMMMSPKKKFSNYSVANNTSFAGNDSFASSGPQSPITNQSTAASIDDTKKLIEQQQVALDNMKFEMAQQQQQFMLALQQQQQANGAASPTQQLSMTGVDPAVIDALREQLEQHQQQQQQQIVQQQDQIAALQKLLQKNQAKQQNKMNSNTTTNIFAASKKNPLHVDAAASSEQQLDFALEL